MNVLLMVNVSQLTSERGKIIEEKYTKYFVFYFQKNRTVKFYLKVVNLKFTFEVVRSSHNKILQTTIEVVEL